MAKYCGNIGFAKSADDGHGVWEEVITEKKYYGDVLRNTRRWSGNDKIVEDITISNQFSILADSFAKSNIGAMKYITYLGERWKIENVDVQYPRLVISVGGIYNGPEPEPDPAPTVS